MDTNRLLLLMVLVAAVVASGCLPPPAPPPDGTPPPPGKDNACSPYERPTIDSGSSGFSGDNAFSYVLDLVCDFSADQPMPQYRIPGTPGQAAGAEMLRSTLTAHGWNASFQNFTGDEYAALHGREGVSYFYGDPEACSNADRQRLEDLPFSNVVAELDGEGEDLILLMAHYDSKRAANEDSNTENRSEPVLGANDGASGVGVLLEAARLLATAGPVADLRILFTDGEDGFQDCHPLAGSIWHAEHLEPVDEDRLIGVLLLDMVGNPEDTYVLTGNDQFLQDVLAQAGEDADAPAIANARQAGTNYVVDDHSPFMGKGLPAVDVIAENFSGTDYWHTTKDTPDRLSPDRLAEVGRATIRFTELVPAAA